jgi:hypothetical protein
MDQENTMKTHLHRIRSRTSTASTVQAAQHLASVHSARRCTRPFPSVGLSGLCNQFFAKSLSHSVGRLIAPRFSHADPIGRMELVHAELTKARGVAAAGDDPARPGRIVMHKFPKEAALTWAAIFTVWLIAVYCIYACAGPTYVLQSIGG